jgi:lipopolysaccharide transport system ATP-binding protein
MAEAIQPIVRVEGLGKQYVIGRKRDRYRTLRSQLADGFLTPYRRLRHVLSGHGAGHGAGFETFWALRDVSFDVSQGEVVGIIGRNGAGKSTLLKVLSRITEPTTGAVEIQGRVGSLLEVGTGFHPELTGRENVFLNGAILGMKRKEIEAKFDEIVAFAEIEQFLETAVKHYSSGMYVRLAFAVAAHLEPEVLIVDEVLSVGDAGFQQKCLGKMNEVAHAGRTVLFVSHNMGAIDSLCTRAILLEDGTVKHIGDPADVVATYLRAGVTTVPTWSRDDSDERPGRNPAPDVALLAVRVLDSSGDPATVLPFDKGFAIEVAYRVVRPVCEVAVTTSVTDARGNMIWASHDTDESGSRFDLRDPGEYVSACRVPARFLRPGHYTVNVSTHVPGVKVLDWQESAVGFEMSPVGFTLEHNRRGVVTPILDWEVQQRDLTAGSAAGIGALPRLETA